MLSVGLNLWNAGEFSAGSSASLPPDAVGAWYASNYNSTLRAVPNAMTAVALSQNLLRAPRRLFGTGTSSFWGGVGCALTNDAATAPDGTTEATTVVGTGNWYVFPSFSATLPAGTYTMAVQIRSGTGGNQSFKQAGGYALSGTTSANKTATTTLQRFTHTFTAASSFALNTVLFAWSIDGSTGATLEICDACLYAGATAPDEPTLAGHMYLGAHTGDTGTPASTSYIDLSSTGFGVVQFPTAYTGTAYTLITIAAKTASGSSHHAALSKAQNYLNMTAYFEVGSVAGNVFGGTNTLAQSAGLWGAQGKGYFAYGARHTGAENTVWINDAKLLQKTQSASSVTLRDYWLGLVNDQALKARHRVAAMALWNRALTDDEMRQAVAFLKTKAAAGSITTEDERILVAEGDSITEASGSYVYLAGPNLSPWGFGVNYAVSGSAISDLNTRASKIDAIIPPTETRGAKKYILSVLIGANDLGAYAGGAAAWLAALQTYCAARRSAGFKVVVCTVLPTTDATHNSRRATVNAALTSSWVSSGYCDAVVNFDSNPTIAADAAASNATYYTGGTHPTAAGHVLLEAIYRPVINSI